METNTLTTIGSGSAGNCYLLTDSAGAVYMLDAGVHYTKVKRALKWGVSKLKAVYVTHAHKDHSKYASYWQTRGIKVFEAYKEGHGIDTCYVMSHDVSCVGYVLTISGLGNFAYITDTGYVPYVFGNLNHLLIEANYCELMLEENLKSKKINNALYQRIIKNHLSVQQVAEFIKKHDISKLATVTICHISNDNGNNEYFKNLIEGVIGFPVNFAENGSVIHL